MNTNDKIGFQLRKIVILINRYIEKENQRTGLTNIQGLQAGTLTYLHENSDRDIFQRDIEKALSIRRSTASNLLHRMEKNGYITRTFVDYDARLRKIDLTEKAMQNKIKFFKLADNLEDILKKDLKEEDLNNFLTTIKKMKRNLEDKL